MQLLHSAYERNLMDADADHHRRALATSETRVTDVMVPPRPDGRRRHGRPDQRNRRRRHRNGPSRFPVIDGDRDKVLGILLAKDLLRLYTEKDFDPRLAAAGGLHPRIEAPQRAAAGVPRLAQPHGHRRQRIRRRRRTSSPSRTCSSRSSATSRTNTTSTKPRQHPPDSTGRYRVKARTEIADFNAAFGTSFSDEEFDTVGGLVLRHLGRVPKRNEIMVIDGTVPGAAGRQPATLPPPGGPAPVNTGVATALPERPALRLGTAALAGAAGVACFQPFGLFWLAPWSASFVCSCARPTGPRTAAWLSFAFGLGFFLVGVSWIYVSLSVFGGMPVARRPATFLFCALLAAFPGRSAGLPALAAGRHLFQAPCGSPPWWGWLTGGGAGSLRVSLAGLGLLPVASQSSGGIRAAGRGFRPEPRVCPGGALLQPLAQRPGGLGSCCSGPAAPCSGWRGPNPGSRRWRSSRQRGIPGDERRPEPFFRTLALYRDLVENTRPACRAPETAVPPFSTPSRRIPRRPAGPGRRIGAICLRHRHRQRLWRYWNSAVSLGTAPTQVYSKSHLVPFGEFIPAGFSWFLESAAIPMSQFARGEQPQAALESPAGA